MEGDTRDLGRAARALQAASLGASWRGRPLPAEYYLLDVEFAMRFDGRRGREADDVPRLFEMYVNRNPENVTEDMGLLFPAVLSSFFLRR